MTDPGMADGFKPSFTIIKGAWVLYAFTYLMPAKGTS